MKVKQISVLMIALFIFLGSGKVWSQQQTAGAPAEKRALELSGNNRGMELPGKRTCTAKTFFDPETETSTAVLSAGFVHRQVGDHFEEIDRRVVRLDSSQYGNRQGFYRAFFKNDLKGQWPFEIQANDNFSIKWKIVALVYLNNSDKKYQKIYDFRDSQPVVAKNTITYPSVFPGMDLVLHLGDVEVKEELVITQYGRDKLPAPEKFGLNPQTSSLMLLAALDYDKKLTPFLAEQNIKTALTHTKEQIDFRFAGKNSFCFPMNWAFLEQDRENTTDSWHPLDKLLFMENSKQYFMVGLEYKDLLSIPPGTLVLDPTTVMQPDAAKGRDARFGHDADAASELKNFGASTYIQLMSNYNSANYYGGRSVIYFDLACIPANAVIQSAQVKLYYYSNQSLFRDSTAHVAYIHEVSRAWTEGTGNGTQTNNGVDYQRYNGTTYYWTTVGGDFASPRISKTTIYRDSTSKWINFDVASSVSAMVAGTRTNNGWLLKWWDDLGTPRVDGGALFYSSDYTTDVTKRPCLEVKYKVDPLVTVKYDAAGRADSISLANGTLETNTFSAMRNWLETRRYQKVDTTQLLLTNSYDVAGNIIKQAYRNGTTAYDTLVYEYNAVRRLTRHTYYQTDQSPVQKNYAYDKNGNRATIGTETFSYNNPNNQLDTLRTSNPSVTVRFGFDAIGRVVSITNNTSTPPTGTLAYDYLDNMISYAGNTYTYDAQGQRLRKTEGAATTYYITSGPEILAEYDATNILKAEYIYALGQMICKYDPAQGYLWYYTDHLNSTRRLDGSNESTGDLRRDYSPYGEELTTAGTVETNYQFSQKELDNGIGLYYFGARYYSPKIGRWLVPDPAGQGWSPYEYCGGNPVMFHDPNGEWFGIDDLIITGVSFTIGYLQHGITTGNWGKDAIVAGGISAGSAWLAYNTGGAAAGALFKNSASAGYAITASTIGGAVGGFTNSVGMQAYFNNGHIDMDQALSAAGYGTLGGLAGGISGQFITSNPILTSMIGGAVSGGLEGGYQGAFMGAWWGGMNGSLTSISYEQYGKYLTKKNFPDGIDENWSCHDFRNELLKRMGNDEYVMFESAWENPIDSPLLGLKKGELSWFESHSGVSLGRNQYGQYNIFSKLNSNQPITVQTSTSFLKMYSGARVYLAGYGYAKTIKSRMLFY